MGIGKFILGRFGARRRYQPFFERMLRMGAAGLGYGLPMVRNATEEFALRNALGNTNGRLTIFDAGANRGEYVELALRVANGRPVTVHAFEPDPAIAQRLRERFANNAQVKVVGNGLSDTPHRATFYKHRLDFLSSLHYTESEPNPSNYRERDVIGKLDVELTTIDTYCAAEGITRIDFLKVDVEGHDLFVLKGAQQMLGEARIHALQFEFCELNITSRATFFDFWNLLKDRYDLFRMCVDGEYRIERYDTLLHEIYYPVNFLARRKDQTVV